jgi:pyruvate/2-oxoglutarate dehydrogenase complex dihydrolipoamide acyltransferase (E2) component
MLALASTDGMSFTTMPSPPALHRCAESDNAFRWNTNFVNTQRAWVQAAQRELAVTREKAANEAKSEFMSLMCHEVRTPLNGCLASAEMLLETPLLDEQRELTNTIRISGSILLSTVSNFLDFFKVQAGKKLDIVRTPFQIMDLITDVHCIVEAMMGPESSVRTFTIVLSWVLCLLLQCKVSQLWHALRRKLRACASGVAQVRICLCQRAGRWSALSWCHPRVAPLTKKNTLRTPAGTAAAAAGGGHARVPARRPRQAERRAAQSLLQRRKIHALGVPLRAHPEGSGSFRRAGARDRSKDELPRVPRRAAHRARTGPARAAAALPRRAARRQRRQRRRLVAPERGRAVVAAVPRRGRQACRRARLE